MSEDVSVALRKESVDRNCVVFSSGAKADRSLSARRAWIEIKSGLQPLIASLTSLSARRAWIEIVYPGTWSGSILSLSARRAWIEILIMFGKFVYFAGRSPQGERG